MAIDLEQLFIESGALKRGHFLLASGRHSDQYLEKFDLLRNPGATSQVLEPLAAQLRDWDIDVIVGPTTGGILAGVRAGASAWTACGICRTKWRRAVRP